jgi:flagella basal body P-ring formation protein FlgA
MTTNSSNIFFKNFDINVFFILLFLFFSCLVGYAEDIMIKSEAEVSGDVVMLGDILEGIDNHSINEIPLFPAPKPGYARTVPNSLILSKLKQAGIDSEKMQIDEAGQSIVKRTTTVISKEVLAESLRHYIQGQIPWDIQQTRIEIYPPAEDLVLPEGDVEISWKPSSSYRYLGSGVFRGTIRIEGKVQKTVICRVLIETQGLLVVAVRDIPRGKLIFEKDVSVHQTSLSRNTGGAVWDLNSVVGMSAKKFIPSGSSICLEDLESPVIIKRNQLVPVEYAQGCISISAKVKALSDARIGEHVRCMYLDSEQTFDAIVQPDGTVKVE